MKTFNNLSALGYKINEIGLTKENMSKKTNLPKSKKNS
jgi:hypothetical protein